MINAIQIGKRIAEIREAHGLSQGDLAARLGIAQSALSKHESGCSDLLLLQNIADVLGLNIMDLIQVQAKQFQHQKELQQYPYAQLDSWLMLLDSYCKDNPEILNSIKSIDLDDKNQLYESFNQLHNIIAQFRRKPVLGISGRSDAGKSTFVNYLIGLDLLPTSYQPLTKVPTLLVHITEKPNYLSQENMLILFTLEDKEGKKISYHQILNSKDRHPAITKIASTGSIKEFTTHSDTTDIEDIEAKEMAIVFCDSVFLKRCMILDLPGYNNTAIDAEIARSMIPHIDILVYMSNLPGFMGGDDIKYLAEHIRYLPYFQEDDALGVLGNLIIIASRCGNDDNDTQVEEALLTASKRLYLHLEKLFTSRALLANTVIGPDGILARFVPFDTNVSHRASKTSQLLETLICDSMPKVWNKRSQNNINIYIEGSHKIIKDGYHSLEQKIHHRKEIIDDCKLFIAQAPEIIRKINEEEVEVMNKISIMKKNIENNLEKEMKLFFTPDHIEKLLTRSYQNRKDAQKYVGTLISENVSAIIHEQLKRGADEVSEIISKHLMELQNNFNLNGYDNIKINFSEIALTGLVGAGGSIGLLGVWGSIVAAGSNLGGFIAVAKIAGVLGLNPLTMTWLIGAVGGPFAALIGIGLFGGLITGAITWVFGKSWQTKMAHEIVMASKRNRTFEESLNKVNQLISETIKTTKFQFETIRNKIDLEKNERIAFINKDPETASELESLILHYDKLKLFFSQMPIWKQPLKKY